MKEAIEKAIKGGWGKFVDRKHVDVTVGESIVILKSPNKMSIRVHKDGILNDPQFWFGLFWADLNIRRVCAGCGEDIDFRFSDEHCTQETINTWQYMWHRFIDHLAEDGDVDTFFYKILKQPLAQQKQ